MGAEGIGATQAPIDHKSWLRQRATTTKDNDAMNGKATTRTPEAVPAENTETAMQTVTIHLNETGQKYMRRMLERYESTNPEAMVEKALLMHLANVDRVHELEKKLAELQAVIDRNNQE